MGCTLIVCEYDELAFRAAAFCSERWAATCEAEAASSDTEAGAATARRHELRVLLHTGKTQAPHAHVHAICPRGTAM